MDFDTLLLLVIIWLLWTIHQDLVENETINDNDDVVEILGGEAYDNKCAGDVENGNSEEIKVATVTPATSKEEV